MDQRFEKLVKDSEDWYRLGSEKGDLKKLLSGLYPDKAHFIYELIQNADDALAQNISICLYNDKVIIEHDGLKKIDFADIKAITGFSISNKDENEKIGKFGIGFKSVYMFTDKPEIISDDYHFSIRHVVIPEIIDEKKRNTGKTIFIIPFNNSKKTKEECYSEILSELQILEYNCLLFLPHIEKILVEDKVSGWRNKLLRTTEETDKNLIKLHSNNPQGGSKTDYFLVYRKDVFWETNKNFLVSVAFPVSVEENKIKLKTNVEGSTYIYFPAINSISNLRFHINAPFASTPDRSSIIDNSDNLVLMEKLGDTVCDAIKDFRIRNLIDKDLFEILPNQEDSIKPQYEIIRDKIIGLFRTEEVIPMNAGGYGKYSDIYSTSNEIRDLLPDSFAHLYFETSSEKVWIKNFSSNSKRAALFYENLDIQRILKNDGFLEIINHFQELLKLNNKQNTWLKHFYEMVYSYKSEIEYNFNYGSEFEVVNQLKNTSIFLAENGDYYKSNELCFYEDETAEKVSYENKDDLLFLNDFVKKVFENDDVFLQYLGIQLFNEEKVNELRISNLLSDITTDTLLNLFENYNNCIKKHKSLISGKLLFFCQDGKFHKASEVIIPNKYYGLDYSQYYNSEVFPGSNYCELDDYYFSKINENNTEDFCLFLKKLGVVSHISIIDANPRENPNWEEIHSGLIWSARGYVTQYDYKIKNIAKFLQSINYYKSLLILNEINSTWNKSDYLIAKVRWADSHPFSKADSTLLAYLKETAWIPQGNDTFVKPEEAIKNKTPQEFLEMSDIWVKKLFNFKEPEVLIREEKEEKNDLSSRFILLAKEYISKGYDIERALLLGIEQLDSERGNL